MKFLINATNIKSGGGIQVVQSICDQLRLFPKHNFILVLSTYIDDENVTYSSNSKIIRYNIKHTLWTVLLGRDSYLDSLVDGNEIDAVLTVFGPSIWKPKKPHLCGFARAQLILKESPYYAIRSLKEKIVHCIWKWAFKKSSRIFYTENPYISHILEKSIPGSKVYTVTNYYNQIFDHPEKWKREVKLPPFEGTTMITISSIGAHKNLGIMVPVAEYLKKEHPNFNFRFVLTCDNEPFQLPAQLKKHFLFVGKVDVSECPNLYEQANIMFMPTLMECFTATYPEAMRMEVPIVTTDLEFARSLCGEAVCYYSAVDPKAAAEAIFMVATDKEYAAILVENGKKQLLTYDNYEQRADKLVKILEEIAK